jgi:hypothetical protein
MFLFPQIVLEPILDHSRSLGSLGCLEGLLQKPNVPKPVCFEVRGMSRIPALRFGRKGLVATKNDDDLSRSTTVSWRKHRKRTEDRSVLVCQFSQSRFGRMLCFWAADYCIPSLSWLLVKTLAPNEPQNSW